MKTLPLTEAQIELQILDYLNIQKKILAWKQPSSGYFDAARKRFRKHTSPYALNGVPDILCVYYGRFLGFEVKTLKGKLSESQILMHQKIRKALGLVYTVRSVEEVRMILYALETGGGDLDSSD